MHVLTWALPPVTIAECVRINFDNWSQQRQLALRMPGCPTCLPEGESASRTFVLPHAYEQSIMTPPRNLLNPKIHQGHYQPANLMITKDFKRYPASPKIPLPPPSQEPVPRGFIEAQTCHVTQARQLDVTTFSALLRRVGGLRSLEISSARDRVQRWIPTGGNLGSVQIYPLVRSVSGLRPGVYHYQPLEHALIDLPSSCDETELAALMEQSCPDVDPEFAVALVLTGALTRVRFKYQSFSYKVVCLDAGVALAQARAVANGYGLHWAVALQWDDWRIADLLGLDPEIEPITGVMLLYGTQPPDGSLTRQRGAR